MRIQVNTDRNIDGDNKLTDIVIAIVESALARSSDQITRVEVHLSDQNSGKKGGNDDIRCMMEARLEGQHPISADHDAATVAQAVEGAAGKVGRKIASDLGKSRDKQRSARVSMPDQPESSTPGGGPSTRAQKNGGA